MAEEINLSIEVSDAAFPYLVAQKGKLEPLSHDRDRWHLAYENDLWSSFLEMRPYLPERCWALLDIGSGLGGIDVLIARHYGSQPFLNLLDGIDDPPEMKLHRQTFSNERVARAFLKDNGVRGDRVFYFGPQVERSELCKPYDLVLSLGSWCFHYAPDEYLPRLIGGGGLHMESRVIVDLRKDKPEWREQLKAANLQLLHVIRDELKYLRVVLERQR